MRNVLLIFASAAINAAITYFIVSKFVKVKSFEDQATASESAQDKED